MTNILNGLLPTGFKDTKDFIPMEGTPFAYNALNLVFAPPSYGKSYAVCNALKNIPNTIYLDFDFNSTSFKNHCEACNIEYANMGNVWENLSNTQKLTSLIPTLPENTVIIVDSLASVLPSDVDINNSTAIATALRELNDLMLTVSATIILIDHATKLNGKDGKIIGFKVEGSETGKFKQCSVAVKYEPTDIKAPSKGGTMTVHKSRLDGINVGTTYNIGLVATLKDAAVFMYAKVGTDSLTKSEFTKITQHSKDIWIRDFKDKLYKEETTGRTTTLAWNLNKFTMDSIKKQIKEGKK